MVLELADVVVYDRLVFPGMLNFSPANAEYVYVGKSLGRHTVTQEQIQDMLIQFAIEGKTVVRLKGGDPFVFGRGGEEAEALSKHGVPWEVVPGITSAVSVPAYAGIPLTHRDLASSFTVVTGHERAISHVRRLHFSKVAHEKGTLVILMGVGQLGSIVQELCDGGISRDSPTAIVRYGTWAQQEVVQGTLGTIVDVATKANLESPAVIVIGETVRLRETLLWFERKPLFGQRVLVVADLITEAKQEAALVEAEGAEVFDFALERHVIKLEHRFDGIIAALKMGSSTCIVFSSALGVHLFSQMLRDSGIDMRALAKSYFVATDDSVRTALLQVGLQADFVGEVICSEREQSPAMNRAFLTWVEAQTSRGHFQPSLVHYECLPILDESRSAAILALMSAHFPLLKIHVAAFYQFNESCESLVALIRFWGFSDGYEVRTLSQTALRFFEYLLALKLKQDATKGLETVGVVS